MTTRSSPRADLDSSAKNRQHVLVFQVPPALGLSNTRVTKLFGRTQINPAIGESPLRCPACKGRVLSFGAWCQGVSAFRHLDCPHCRAPLRPNRRTWIVFAAVIVLLSSLALAVATGLAAHGVSPLARKLLIGGIVIPLVMGIGYWEWHVGSYKLRSEEKRCAEPDAPADGGRDSGSS